MEMIKILEQRCCDYDKNSTNEATVREWIHETYKYVYRGEDISDESLNKLSEKELKRFIDELDWLSWK